MLPQSDRPADPATLRDADGYLPLARYGALGDGRAVVLSGADGSIDWWCVPNMDSPPLFDRLLDGQKGGWFAITPNASSPAATSSTPPAPRRFRTSPTSAPATGGRRTRASGNCPRRSITPCPRSAAIDIETPMTDAMMEKRAKEQGAGFAEAVESFLKEERPGMTLRRRGKAEEVAAAILFLCSAPASFVNGANLRVDSGSVMTMAG